jgi:hypothetical protein
VIERIPPLLHELTVRLRVSHLVPVCAIRDAFRHILRERPRGTRSAERRASSTCPPRRPTPAVSRAGRRTAPAAPAFGSVHTQYARAGPFIESAEATE